MATATQWGHTAFSEQNLGGGFDDTRLAGTGRAKEHKISDGARGRGDRPEVWSSPRQARHRTLSSLPAFQFAGHRTSALGRRTSRRSSSGG
jgi:hypothetical protein